jgi:UDP-MurNAc hydroxylase
MTFLGHAGFDLCHLGVRLIVDPWLVGTAFDNGWELLFPAPGFDATGITHLWFSHEHPDHFSPPSLKLIPPEVRANVTVIVQRAEDARLADFMRTQGYGDVIEVEDGRAVPLTNAAGEQAGTITTLSCAMGDSAHLVELGGVRILNTNDCSFDGPTGFKAALSKLGADAGPIDLLISQYSYANWVGNPEDVAERKAFAEHKLDLLWEQVELAKPKYVFPCASFIVFAHEENLYLNDCINDLGDVCARLEARHTVPVVMQNGDAFSLDEEGFRAMHALVPAVSARVAAEIDRVRTGSRPPLTSPVIPLPELVELAESGLARLREGVSKVDFAIMQRQLPKAVFELRDHEASLVIDKLSSVTTALKGSVPADAMISSAALEYAFKNDFGFETLLVNGRFEKRHAKGDVAIRKLTGQFGYLRRKQSLVRSIVERRVTNPALRMARTAGGYAAFRRLREVR